jgi:hypothetical protein
MYCLNEPSRFLKMSLAILLFAPSIHWSFIFNVTDRSNLDKDSVFKIDEVLARNPAKHKARVSGAGVRLSPSAKYKVSVEFQFAGTEEDKEYNLYRRVKIYKPSDSIKTDCSSKECWISLAQFTNDGVPAELELDAKDLGSIFVTSWTPTPTTGRTGIPDKYLDVEELDKKRGIKLKFASSLGETFVTIVPR